MQQQAQYRRLDTRSAVNWSSRPATASSRSTPSPSRSAARRRRTCVGSSGSTIQAGDMIDRPRAPGDLIIVASTAHLQRNAADVEAGPAARCRRGLQRHQRQHASGRQAGSRGAARSIACSAWRSTARRDPRLHRRQSVRSDGQRCLRTGWNYFNADSQQSAGRPLAARSNRRLGCHAERQPGGTAAGAHADGRATKERASRCWPRA